MSELEQIRENFTIAEAQLLHAWKIMRDLDVVPKSKASIADIIVDLQQSKKIIQNIIDLEKKEMQT